VILLDTSGLLAALFADQRDHERCRQALERADPPLLLSPFVLAELDYLIRTGPGVRAELALLQEVADEAYRLESFSAADIAEARAVAARYRDLSLGLADASLVVLSRRYDTLDLLTLDERHFRTVAGAGGRPFRLLPADA
jgi:uncharacterized protein